MRGTLRLLFTGTGNCVCGLCPCFFPCPDGNLPFLSVFPGSLFLFMSLPVSFCLCTGGGTFPAFCAFCFPPGVPVTGLRFRAHNLPAFCRLRFSSAHAAFLRGGACAGYGVYMRGYICGARGIYGIHTERIRGACGIYTGNMHGIYTGYMRRMPGSRHGGRTGRDAGTDRYDTQAYGGKETESRRCRNRKRRRRGRRGERGRRPGVREASEVRGHRE